MSRPAYTAEAWFSLLSQVCESRKRKDVAKMLGISPTALSLVLNGTGLYGNGQASTAKIADRVLHTFGRFVCPHLTEQADAETQAAGGVVIEADRCRAFAHRPAPTGSPRDLRHWQACLHCHHRDATAPAQPRPVVPRKPKAQASTATAVPATQETLP